MPSIAQSERVALCALLEDKGPLAPTLCEGWATSDLAAHLYVRERRPLAGLGIVIKPLAGLTDKEIEKAKRQLGYIVLIDKIRSGPPAYLKPIDEQVNAGEYFVHHEDVRRAAEGFEPREDAELDAALWSSLKRGARLAAFRLKGAGLDLSAPGYGVITAKKGTPTATLVGGPQELTLYIFGRKKVAQVSLEGPEAATKAVEAARFGL